MNEFQILMQELLCFIPVIVVGSFNLNVCQINCLQSVGSGLSLEPPATTEPDEEEDGMSDIIQEVRSAATSITHLRKACRSLSSTSLSGHRPNLESGS